MNIAVVALVLNQQEITQRFLNTLRENEEQRFPLVIVDNGSTPPVREWLIGLRDGDMVIRNGENEGVVRGMNQAFAYLDNQTDYILFIHNDVMVYQKKWDTALQQMLSELPDCGCAGFYGAKGIGVPHIYKVPYEMQQLVRIENVSNCTRMNAAIHGFRNIRNNDVTHGKYEEVAVLDGFSLIVKTELLRRIGGFDRSYPPHHMYDNDMCMESIDKGYRNYVLAMDADHLGGRTDVGENWNVKFGKTKADIHRDAHPVFYRKWSPDNVANKKHTRALPVYIP